MSWLSANFLVSCSQPLALLLRPWAGTSLPLETHTHTYTHTNVNTRTHTHKHAGQVSVTGISHTLKKRSHFPQISMPGKRPLRFSKLFQNFKDHTNLRSEGCGVGWGWADVYKQLTHLQQRSDQKQHPALTQKSALQRRLLQPLLGDDVLTDVDGMEEFDGACQLLGHQVGAVLRVFCHPPP